MPMVHVLAGLEATGICVDQGVFEVRQLLTARHGSAEKSYQVTPGGRRAVGAVS